MLKGATYTWFETPAYTGNEKHHRFKLWWRRITKRRSYGVSFPFDGYYPPYIPEGYKKPTR